MSGVLRTVAQVGLTVAAFALGGPAGAYWAAGVNLAFGIIFPPKQNTPQAKPANLDLNISDPDGPMPCFYGIIGGVGGNYVTVAKDKDDKPSGVLTVKSTRKVGGKGGGGQKVTEYHYYLIAEMALGYAGDGGPLIVDKLEMIDGDGTTVLFDRFAEDEDDQGMQLTEEYSDAGTLISESGKSSKGEIHFYRGTEEQQPCAFLEEYWGVGNITAHRGVAKIGFNRVEMSGQPTFKATVRAESTDRRDIIVQRFEQVRIPKSRMRIEQVRGDVQGVAISGRQPARQLCEQLASRVFCAFAFNNARIEDFYKLNVKRWTLQENILAAREADGDSETPDRVKVTLKGEDDFYSQVEAGFMDADTGYEENTGVATRDDSKNSNPNSVSFPEAARLADIVPWCQSSLDEDGLADHSIAISVMPGQCEIALGNIIEVPIRKMDGSTMMRDYLVSEIQLQPSGVLDITGTPYSELTYTQTAVNNAGQAGDGVRVLKAPVSFIAQAPALSDEQLGNVMLEDPGVIVAATVDDDLWSNNGVIFDFNNNRNNLTALAFPATMGKITEDFSLGECYDYDQSRTLDITMYGDGVLQTADIADVRAGANLLLFETGRVISFTTATQTGLKEYQIAGIKDGRFGSDYTSQLAVYRVAGGGTSNKNRDYMEWGTRNGKPFYRSDNGKYIVWRADKNQWWIDSTLDGNNSNYYNTAATSTPPATGWQRGSGGDNPVPTVTLLSSLAPSGTKVLLLHNHEGDMEGSIGFAKSTFSYLNRNITSSFFPNGRDEVALTATESFRFAAQNLRSPAPVAVRCVRGGDGSAVISGRLRTRIMDDGAWNTSSPGTMTDAYQGEFGIGIYLTDGTNVVRQDFTSTSVEFSITLSASQLTSWFGSLPATLSGDILQTNRTVGDGRPRAFTE